MAEIGEVIEVKEPYVVVRLIRSEACGKCNACSVGLQSTEMILEAENRCDAKLGDQVEIFLKEANFLKAVFIMYVIPLFALMAGLVIGYMIFENELLIFGIGILMMATSYILIRMNEKRFKTSEFRPIALSKQS
ncbi:MAG: SoxR reducing system RseC family protein [Vallitaleaceae bacterium]|jgi:sigma-E factor negative regulatory protein RseC|nr:SoxR reducing system RseC family protein [Vallitaleaceae bacterium]